MDIHFSTLQCDLHQFRYTLTIFHLFPKAQRLAVGLSEQETGLRNRPRSHLGHGIKGPNGTKPHSLLLHVENGRSKRRRGRKRKKKAEERGGGSNN